MSPNPVEDVLAQACNEDAKLSIVVISAGIIRVLLQVEALKYLPFQTFTWRFLDGTSHPVQNDVSFCSWSVVTVWKNNQKMHTNNS